VAGIARTTGQNGSASRPAGKAPLVAAALIVRDEEANLPDCLDSLDGVVDQFVVVDTGSVDRTREIALAPGATVLDFPWCDDFAAARNFGLPQVPATFTLIIDLIRTHLLPGGVDRFRDEGYGMAILEAMAKGIRPVIHDFLVARELWVPSRNPRFGPPFGRRPSVHNLRFHPRALIFRTVDEAVEWSLTAGGPGPADCRRFAEKQSLARQVERVRRELLGL
jgi:glycosyltransferase involved in cell wall biosynthesis